MKNEKFTIIEHRGEKIKLNEEALDRLYELQFGYDYRHPSQNEGVTENINGLCNLYDSLVMNLEYTNIEKGEIHEGMKTVYNLGQFFRVFKS